MKRLSIIVVLWLPFSIGCILSIITSLIAIAMDENEYGKNVLRAMDKVLAATVGFSGFFTLSAECGVSNESPWMGLRKILDMIDPGHCEGAAKNEGLI